MRPLNSCIGSPTYKLSKYLASVLKHLANETEYSVKNAQQFVEFVSNEEVAEDELVASFGVISLFTSIPIGMAIDIVQKKLEGFDDWKNHTQLTRDQILDLLSFLLHNSYFIFEGTQYHQVSGCAMGSPVSAVIAELIMQEVEEKAIETSPVRPKWWRCYVDDSNACINKRDDVEVFHSPLNSISICTNSIHLYKGVSERIRRILNRENIRRAFKPLKTLVTFLKNLRTGRKKNN